jgi:protein-disulfide isomerase
MMNANNEMKTSFWFGFFSGVSSVSVIVFIALFLLIFSGKVGGTGPAPVATAPTTITAPTVGDTAQPVPEVPSVPVPDIKSGEYVKGNPNAPVTLIEYSDFECPFCQRFVPTVEQLLREYPEQVKIVYRHFPLSFHPNAQKAAEAAECAGEQGKFWEMHDILFAKAEQGTMGVEIWKTEASVLGLNTTQFNTCLDSGKYASKVANDMNEGAASGVSGTPATFVNGVLISGAVPYAQLKAQVDQALAK